MLDASFYKSTSGNILMEICALSATPAQSNVQHNSCKRQRQAKQRTWCLGKEYAKADSRYATRDSFVISMEAVTAFLWGPLCLLCVYAIARRWAWRHLLQACCPSAPAQWVFRVLWGFSCNLTS